MQKLFEVREYYGGIYATVFEEYIIPWKPLSLGDYIKYSQEVNRSFIPKVQIENEIFVKCVQDKVFIRQLPFIKAGTVSTVVENIWQYSGPVSIEAFNNDLETARSILNADGVRALHDLVQTITIAFPYKPEEVYAMDYETFLLRLAQSEKKLMFLGMQQTPITLVNTEQIIDKKQIVKNKLKNLNLKEEWEKQKPVQQQKPINKQINQDFATMTRDKWWKKSPVLETSKPALQGDLNLEIQEQSLGMSGHEKLDIAIERKKLADRGKIIYADLIKEWQVKHKK